jgi:hypothetical protein
MVRIVEDVLVPLGVTGAHMGLEKFDADKGPEETKISPIVGIVLLAAGYGLSAMGIGGNYTKNMAIASMDWGAHSIKEMVEARGLSPVSRRLAMRSRVSASETSSVPTYAPEEEIVYSVT